MKKLALFTMWFFVFCTFVEGAWQTGGNNVTQEAAGYKVSQGHPASVLDSSGKIFVVFQDNRHVDSAYHPDLYVQYLDANGNRQIPNNGNVICTAYKEQTDPIACTNGNGGIFTIWRDTRASAENQVYRVYLQKTDANGNSQFGSGGLVIFQSNNSTISDLAIAYDGNSGVVVGWIVDNRIIVRRYMSNGNVQWSKTINPAYGAKVELRLVLDSYNNFVVVWTDGPHDNNDIYATKVDSDGNVVSGWDINGNAVVNTYGNQSSPSLAADDQGGIGIIFRDSSNGNKQADIHFQYLNNSGQRAYHPYLGICTAGSEQNRRSPYDIQHQQIIYDGTGFMIVWDDSRNGLSDIYFQRVIVGSGVQLTANGKAVCTATGEQRWPRLVWHGTFATIIWNDHRAARWGIYGRRVDVNGNLSWPDDGKLLVYKSNKHLWYPLVHAAGSGNTLLVWVENDLPSNTGEIMALKVNSNGNIAN